MVSTYTASGKAKPNMAKGDIFNTTAFIENHNLVNNKTGEDILYYSSRDKLTTFFTKKGLIYSVYSLEKEAETGKPLNRPQSKEKEEDREPAYLHGSAISMNWVGANPDAQIIAGEKAPGYYTYLKNAETGLTGVSAIGYKTITYKNIYPGIDVVYSFPEKGGLEYTLIVAPGADISAVQMAYAHDVQNISTDKDGNLVLHTSHGDVTEHAPATIDEAGHAVASLFVINNNVVGFSFPKGYNKMRKLIIDPWVTALTTLVADNMGLDVDYDYLGNLLVYGAGPQNDVDTTNNFKIAKYGPSGTLLWTFSGMVPSVNWSTATDSDGLDPTAIWPSNFIVDKVTGKVYMGQALGDEGTTVIRLNSSGLYDNFISIPDTTFLEDWGFAYKCSDASVIALGGGISSAINMGIINTGTGAVTRTTITGDPVSTDQDIICGVYDTAGNMYVIMNDILGTLPYTNTIYKVNTAFNGNTWAANSHYTVFNEANNDPFWDPIPVSGANGNWFNCLAANGQYLFYYDGKHVAAYSLATGARLGFTTIAAYTALMQGGIAVDNCNHVYVGGVGVINTFTFSGTAFTADASIPLGGAFGTNPVNDVKYNSSNNLIYVAANGMVGTYSAVLSTTCTTTPYTVLATGVCDSATVHISPSGTLSPEIFNIIWTNSSGAIVSQLNNTADTINTVDGLPSGTYAVAVQWNTNCGGTSVIDTVTINCGSSLIHSNDTTICPNQSVVLSATGTPAGGTYSWSPSGLTTANITVTPTLTTTYTVTYVPPTGPTQTATITVTVSTQPVTVTVNNAALCPGGTAQLFATPSVPGGTYSWSPGGDVTDTINVAPPSTTVYTVTYTASCGSATGSGTVTIATDPDEALTQRPTTCAQNNGAVLITASSGVAPYQYSLNGGAFQAADSFTNLSANPYVVVVKDANGCTDTGAVSVAPSIGVAATLTPTNPGCGGANGEIVVNATGGTMPYAYALNGGAAQTADSFTSLGAGTYIVTTSDAAGCVIEDTAVLVLPEQLVLTLVADGESCFGGATATITASATGGSPAYTYSLNGGAQQATGQFTGLSAGPYTVLVTDAAGCTDSATTSVSQPTAVIIDSTSATAVLCAGQLNGTATVYASGGTPAYSYSIAQGGSTFNSANGSFSDLGIGLYSVTVTDSKGCTVTGAVTVPGATADSFSVATLPTSCYGPGYTDGSLTITALTATGAPYTYTIDSGAFSSSNQFNNLAFGTYYPEVMNNNGCVTVLPPALVAQPAQATLSINPTDTTLQLGQSVTLATDFGPYPLSSVVSYIWSPSEFLSCVICPNPIVTPYAPQMTYQLVVTYNNHCVIDDSVTINMNDNPHIYIPNVFTPNGDGNNDIFYAYAENIKVFNIKVFNRWGEKVFESNSLETGWDGRYKGIMQDPAVFVYEAHFVLLDNTTFFKSGSVTLVR